MATRPPGTECWQGQCEGCQWEYPACGWKDPRNRRQQKEIAERVKAFEEAMKPKVFCGGDRCSGLHNLECDAIEHNDGRELVVKSKVIELLIKRG